MSSLSEETLLKLSRSKTEKMSIKADRTYIYQIGRLDTNVFKEYEFQIDDNIYTTSLSSLAIKDSIAKNNGKPSIILIYPVSLPFNPPLSNNKEFRSSCPLEFMKNIETALNDPEEYLKNPEVLFQHHPHTKKADDFFVIHSLGTYGTFQSPISFDCHYQDILLEMLLNMIEKYLHFINADASEPLEFIIDISSGLNIYVSALLEASRQFGVFLQLSGWHNKDAIPKISIAFSDPILPGQDISHAIHFDKLRVRSLFSSPITNKDISNFALSRKVFPDESERKEKNILQKFLERFLIVLSAVKNNTPLAVYQFGFDNENDLLEILGNFIAYTRKKLFGSYMKSPELDEDAYLKILLTLGFYYGISRMLKENGVNNFRDTGSEMNDINDIKGAFYKIYEAFGLTLNKAILGNEIDRISQRANAFAEKPFNDWKELYVILNPDKNKLDRSPNERNFFAHAGLEQNATQFRIDNGRLLLKYKDEYCTVIKKWLQESV